MPQAETPEPARGALRIAADIGGTFTDVALIRGDGTIATRKVASTPDDYARGVAEGILELVAVETLAPEEIGEVMHACTVATNAILEGKGARTALITTEGFRDVLEMRRIRVPKLYDPLYEKPPALSPRKWRFEVEERMDFRGAVLTPLSEASVLAAIEAIRAAGVDAVAVCLLHAYANPAHERRIGELLAEHLPGVYVSLSVDVLPEIREYERTSTTVINSFVGPPVKTYLNALRDRLAEAGLPSDFFMMHSAGGIVDARTVMAKPAQIVECGPAAGVIGARAVMLDVGHGDAIAFDMGGTTAKASLIEGGQLLRADDYEVGGGISLSSKLAKGGGYALKLPVIDISEVGAGGGSIVWRDRAGALKVGPMSAGAAPGPACYGTGGTEPTVTDANMVLGFLNPEALAGGAVPVDPELSRAALSRVVAEPMGIGLDEAAHGVHELVSTVMMRAVKSVTTFRGRDPRDFAMIAFGGNGGIHSVSLARALGVTEVIVPPGAGVLSALGLLYADIETSAASALLARIDAVSAEAVANGLTALENQVLHELSRGRDAVELIHEADLRYKGQAFELTLPLDEGRDLTPEAVARLREAFELAHERAYGYRLADTPVEFVSLRVTAQVPKGSGALPEYRKVAPAPERRRQVYFGPQWGRIETAIIDRAALAAGPRQGPAIIEEYEGTTIVPPDCSARIDGKGNIILTLPAATAAGALEAAE
ncbi:hydantoinase/oxoprolinase family protein [Salipiger sp. P9]|uniref:hydantoinase/oxoprolinase family protein n=1 Tax=Salipiger pentaromativorans TaxID=2943193 RepID=UPI0021572F09|nr:hydantoinase/oxoprolinase family protein [Salipiger pentaromativorans]MCR8549280.1 hydantoinase/oxoprolinase family protein [Salipiger pentaromativorans]